MGEANLRSERKFRQAKLLHVFVVVDMKWPQRLSLSILEHQYPIVAFSQRVGEFMASAKARHTRLAGQDEDFDLLARRLLSTSRHDPESMRRQTK
jgi:hypothetical protein